MKRQTPRQEVRYQANIGVNMSPFIDADAISQLEPALNKHYLGTPKASKQKSTGTDRYRMRNPPPLPEISSSSDIYAKKIELFKKKLKNLKGMSSNSPKKKKQASPSFSSLQHFTYENIAKSEAGTGNGRIADNIDDATTKPFQKQPDCDFNTESFGSLSPTMLTIPTYNSSNNDTQYPSSSISEMPLRKRSVGKQNVCCICNIDLDSFYNLQDGERIIELQCDHMAHEECLVMELELNLSIENTPLPDRAMIPEYLSHCALCPSLVRAIPKDSKLMTDIYNRILTSHIEKSHGSLNESAISTNSPITPTSSDSPKLLDTETSSPSDFATHQLSALNLLKNQPPFPRALRKSEKNASYKTHTKKASRGSCASGTSAIISSVGESQDESNETSWCAGFSEDLVQRKFIEDLVNLSSQGVIKASIAPDMILTNEEIRSLGSLRMVDKIDMTTYEDGEVSETIQHYCYLFQHMLIALRSTDFQYNLINVNLSTYVDSSEPGILIMKNSKTSRDYHKFIFNSKSLENRWKASLGNMRLNLAYSLFTSTLEVDEFDHLINNKCNDPSDVETLETLKSYIGEDGYRRLPTGVCPRFYEGTINSLVFKPKPTNAIIVLNQSKHIPDSTIPIKNIIRSLSMIGIDILLVLCSTSMLSMDSYIVNSYELSKKNLKRQGDLFLSKIDGFQDMLLQKENSMKEFNREQRIREIISGYIEKLQDTVPLSSILNVIVSNTSLQKVREIPTTSNIMVEIGIEADKKSNRPDVADLADWTDIMEVICVCCGLEFDESDFYPSSGDENEMDDAQSEYDKSTKSSRSSNSVENLCTGLHHTLDI